MAWVRYPAKRRVASAWHLSAGGHHVGAAQVRAWIGDLLDVVRAVAVIALRGLGIAQLGNLAVIGVEVGFGNLLVAAAAGVHDVELELVLVGAANGVRGVAVVANRQGLVRLGHRGGMDALHELLLDAVVASAARRRHVLGIDRRFRVRGRQFSMRGVATGTGCGHRQPALQQPLAVDALGRSEE